MFCGLHLTSVDVCEHTHVSGVDFFTSGRGGQIFQRECDFSVDLYIYYVSVTVPLKVWADFL